MFARQKALEILPKIEDFSIVLRAFGKHQQPEQPGTLDKHVVETSVLWMSLSLCCCHRNGLTFPFLVLLPPNFFFQMSGTVVGRREEP